MITTLIDYLKCTIYLPQSVRAQFGSQVSSGISHVPINEKEQTIKK